MTTPPAPVTSKSLNTMYTIGAVCLVAGALLWIVLIGIPIFIAGVVMMAIFIYRAWSVLPEDEARTTPMLAVALSFIPLFNLFWNFVAFWGLAKDLNAHVAKHSIAAPKAMDTLALICCILVPLGFVPVIGWFVAMPLNAILGLVTLYSIKNTAIAIVDSRSAPTAPA